jgi:hypothetical protein
MSEGSLAAAKTNEIPSDLNLSEESRIASTKGSITSSSQ